MDDNSSSEEVYEETNWVFYKDRDEWRDVKPIPQDDGEFPVVAIAYSEKFKDVYDYFRAVMQNKEYSDRALQLTKDAALLNPGNYTVWKYRRDILKHIGKDLREELEFTKTVIEENAKNYQVWHHRRIIVEWLNDPSEEMEFTSNILDDDAKNYHAWQHRQWVMSDFKLFDDELSFVNDLIKEDIRNNSAWNQRYFVINRTVGFKPDIIKREIYYTFEKIKLVSKNESSWNYLRGILFHSPHGIREPSVMTFCKDLFKNGNRSPHLLAFLVEQIEDALECGSGNEEMFMRAKIYCKELAQEYDSIRANYWNHVASNLRKPAVH